MSLNNLVRFIGGASDRTRNQKIAKPTCFASVPGIQKSRYLIDYRLKRTRRKVCVPLPRMATKPPDNETDDECGCSAKYYAAVGGVDGCRQVGCLIVGEWFDVNQMAGLDGVEPIVEPTRAVVMDGQLLQYTVAIGHAL